MDTKRATVCLQIVGAHNEASQTTRHTGLHSIVWQRTEPHDVKQLNTAHDNNGYDSQSQHTAMSYLQAICDDINQVPDAEPP